MLLVRVAWSCVSPGTELAGASTTTAIGVLQRLRKDPALVRKAIGVLRNSGVRRFSALAQARLGFGIAPGYSCAGTVDEIGEGIEGFSPGDRVACAGSGYASHAEIVMVPRNLVAHIPEEVDLAAASTVTLGAIALQGVRRAGSSIGEKVGVIGLGMVGQLTVQLLKAAGCQVFGTDLDPVRVNQARELGLDDGIVASEAEPVAAALRFSGGYGLDAVIITAATKSDEPLDQAMRMARRKGKVVVVGDVGLAARRDEMYLKELDLVMATSYGPGRYDPSYEEDGLDYPYAYVRWTENRNMQAYLTLLAGGRVRLDPLIAYRLPVDQAEVGYTTLMASGPRPYTVLLEYPAAQEQRATHQVPVRTRAKRSSSQLRLAIVGAGSFARGVHIPILKALKDCFSIEAIVTRHGPNAVAVAKQVDARWAGTDYHEVLADPNIDAVVIATRHHLHASLTGECLRAGKHVFVEKPLALSAFELEELEKARREVTGAPGGSPVVMVGFNRRYSPFARRLRGLVEHRSAPFQCYYRMNVGYLPPDHWVHGPEGGGRLIGEGCHIFDLFRFLAGVPASGVQVMAVRSPRNDVKSTDNFTATVRYCDGSVCTLLYTAQGSRDFPKEYLELAVDERHFVLDDYRHLRCYGVRGDLRLRHQDKGHHDEWQAFADYIEGRLDPEALWTEIVEVSQITLEADRLLGAQASSK